MLSLDVSVPHANFSARRRSKMHTTNVRVRPNRIFAIHKGKGEEREREREREGEADGNWRMRAHARFTSPFEKFKMDFVRSHAPLFAIFPPLCGHAHMTPTLGGEGGGPKKQTKGA